jgi:hypothetical protein
MRLPRLPRLEEIISRTVSWETLAWLHDAGLWAGLILLMFVTLIVLAWYIGKAIVGNDALAKSFQISGHAYRWIWLPPP